MTALESLLDSYRAKALTERDKGTAFEKLVAAWLLADPVQSRRFEDVQLWRDWARSQGRDRTDTGIDLVGTLHGGGFVAVQCKFFDPEQKIEKRDIDSFISASAKPEFAERLIVETTRVPWSPLAESMLWGQAIPTTRIGLQELMASEVDWSSFAGTGEVLRREPRTLRPDQMEALEAVRTGLATADRGKLIMACGTGKTLTSLRIAEDLAGVGQQVLLLMPSLALMAQSVREWCADAILPSATFAVCSDTQVGKRRRSMDDVAELEVTDLSLPATTDAKSVASAVSRADTKTLRVVFATYQSIQVIEKAQTEYGLPEFDLIVCDEAHRTTGVTFAGEDQSNFVKVHDNAVIRGRKRLYMTATPRIYGEGAKSKARELDVVLASMDDEAMYGQVLFHAGFSRAVENGILTDYRVIVLVMDEGLVSASVQKRLSDENSELVLDDATKIIGCWKALSKAGLVLGPSDDPEPMRRALAFCRDIKSSKLIRDEFEKVVNEFQTQAVSENGEGESTEGLHCAVRHVDGTYKARERGLRLDWLKEDADANSCRILSNARCLAEGVDVPALDSILFLHPRNSQIDVVQSVGRVMRRAAGKRMGYVILPVGVPAGVPADQALNDNKKYRVVWQILNALRAHDERLDKVINQGSLGQDVSDRIAIIDGTAATGSPELRAVTAEVDDLPARSQPPRPDIGKGGDKPTQGSGKNQQQVLVIDEFSRAIMAKIVEKCGTRDYWEDWAGDVADIAERHITRISALVDHPGSDAHAFFEDFLKEVRDDLNELISERDAIEMLAQHIITRPVFDALFEGHAFVDSNPVSKAMQEVIGVIDEAHVEREAEKLEGFYASVRRRAAGISEPQARQKLIVELYDKFFRGAFPRTTKMLGIVYTPSEVVDFIIRSVDDVLRSEFAQTLGSKGVHIIDPFTGTGTFITRLLQSGLIAPQDLERKYRDEIHANEIVLLAYYIAAINIETVFHELTAREDYLPFEGICLTDTFNMYESEDQLSFYMKNNSDRRTRQKNTDIRVIIGNPPYSAGQKSENENAQNVTYPDLDQKIRSTYAQKSTATLQSNLYDPYVRAIRWGGDRIGETGVMAYVTNAGWIENNAMDGMRKCIAEEFASVHVFHLRGDQRTSGELSRREGGKIFGSGSRAPIAITIFVKNPSAKEQGRILIHDIGDYLDREQKFEIIRRFSSIGGITQADGWTRITTDRHGDWLDQRDESFEAFLKLGDKKEKHGETCFEDYSLGVVTNRDAWCINPSLPDLKSNISATMHFYNEERKRWEGERDSATAPAKIADFLNPDPKRISWTFNLKQDLTRRKRLDLSEGQFVQCMYRPFTKQWQFYSRRLNERVYRMPRIFPNNELPNRVIAVTGKGGSASFSTLMLDTLPNLHTIDSGQCFPFWLYEETQPDENKSLLAGIETGSHRRREAISETGLKHFREAYPGQVISREDIFHYIYGLLHSEDYRNRFRANLAKDIPRIPCVKDAEEFRAFHDAGQRLGELHVGYEQVEPYPAVIDAGGRDLQSVDDPASFFRVVKMKHPGSGRNKDRSTIIYNHNITVSEIPDAAWDYVVNGKPALAWVMERQTVKTDKASGIVSDANCYAVETVGNPRYPLDLLLRVITVSLETRRIVQALPELQIDEL
ncbi:MAG: DEAD/DEAH box helicase family protein [Bryobacterales bacterium]|nr:DEAD/DEAH box helicase family protein [Bryobacterales bacterium]